MRNCANKYTWPINFQILGVWICGVYPFWEIGTGGLALRNLSCLQLLCSWVEQPFSTVVDVQFRVLLGVPSVIFERQAGSPFVFEE